ncbi:MAG: RHS repeat-associated core domain-containing protein [Chloroflexota bacterium]
MTGRFAQADTLVPGGVQGLDRYAYVNNSPINYIDPSGHIACQKGKVNLDGQSICMDSYSIPAPWSPPPETFDNGKMPATRDVYQRYLNLYYTPGWWNGYRKGNFTIWQFLNLILSMEFSGQGRNWSSSLLQETVVRNFYTQCSNYCDSGSELDVLRYIALKSLTDPLIRDVSPASLKKNETNRGIYNSTNFASAFRNPDEAWSSGCGNGNVPCDWGNLSLKDCTPDKCSWLFTNNPKLNMDDVKMRFNYAIANSPIGVFATQSNLFYSMAGSGDSAFIVTGNQLNCLYRGICP